MLQLTLVLCALRKLIYNMAARSLANANNYQYLTPVPQQLEQLSVEKKSKTKAKQKSIFQIYSQSIEPVELS